MKSMNCSDDASAGKCAGRWVEPEEYLAMATSSRGMLRCDRPEQGVRGLVDVATGERFFVREEQMGLADRHPRDAVSP